MAVPISPSDFALVAEKAWDLYKKLKAAPGQYSNLAEQVLILRGILEDTKCHLEEQEEELARVPSRRKTALEHARQGCIHVLDEVDETLRKYPTLGNKASAGIMARLAFITDDIPELEKDLERNATNLNRCLASLTSVSVLELRKALAKLGEDVRNGRRHGLLLSDAVVRRKKVNVAETVKETESELLQQNIHPDALDLHHEYVKAWVMNTVAEEEAKENTTEAISSTSEQPWESAFAPPEPANGKKQQIYTDSDDEYYGASSSGRKALAVRQAKGKQPHTSPAIHSQGPSSRRSSLGSHRSEPETWHPKKVPYPEFVSAMLSKAITVDPVERKINVVNASFYLTRAFHQQDCYDRDYLTRSEMISLCKDAITKIDPEASTGHVHHLVHDGDRDQNGKVDVSEFVNIMCDVLINTYEHMSEKLDGIFDQLANRAEKYQVARRQKGNPSLLLPWGFTRESLALFDEVEQVEVSTRPPPLPPCSFSMMATDVASYCERMIKQANDQWDRVLPDEKSRTAFRITFDNVRNAAVRFTTFFHPVSQIWLSDLDEIMTILQWVELGGQNRTSHQGYLHDLRSVQASAYRLAHQIKGFVFRLEFRDPNDFTANPASPSPAPTTTTFTEDSQKWKNAYMDAWAARIGHDAEELWPRIDIIIRNTRQWYSHGGPAGVAYNPGIPPIKRVAANHPPPKALAAAGHGSSYNVLHMQAMEIARNHCVMEREEEEGQIKKLRSGGRQCRLESISIERGGKKTIFSTLKKFDMEIEALGPGCRSSLWQSWRASSSWIKGGKLSDIDLILPAWTDRLAIQLSYNNSLRPNSTEAFTMQDLGSRMPKIVESEHGVLKFRSVLEDDPARAFQRSEFPWFKYIRDVYDVVEHVTPFASGSR